MTDAPMSWVFCLFQWNEPRRNHQLTSIVSPAMRLDRRSRYFALRLRDGHPVEVLRLIHVPSLKLFSKSRNVCTVYQEEPVLWLALTWHPRVLRFEIPWTTCIPAVDRSGDVYLSNVYGSGGRPYALQDEGTWSFRNEAHNVDLSCYDARRRPGSLSFLCVIVDLHALPPPCRDSIYPRP
jgi:hypothetical protein